MGLDTEIELTKEKSQEIADTIEMVKLHVFNFDNEYAKEVAKAMRNQASRQQSLAVLNPSYAEEKNALIYKQAETLKRFTEFVDGLKECEKLKIDVKKAEGHRNEINSLFL